MTGTDGRHAFVGHHRATPRPAPPLAIVVASAAGACSRGGTVNVACDMAAPPGNPVEVPMGWSQGYAVVIATIGEPDGRTKVYDPGYRADRYDIDVERVVTVRPRLEVPPGDAYATAYTEADVAAVDSIASVHYPDPPSGCGEKIEVAELEPGARMMLVLGPPDPSKEEWTVDGAPSALDLAEGPTDATVATWQDRRASSAACGHRYDLADLEAAFRDPALAPPCTPAEVERRPMQIHRSHREMCIGGDRVAAGLLQICRSNVAICIRCRQPLDGGGDIDTLRIAMGGTPNTEPARAGRPRYPRRRRHRRRDRRAARAARRTTT